MERAETLEVAAAGGAQRDPLSDHVLDRRPLADQRDVLVPDPPRHRAILCRPYPGPVTEPRIARPGRVLSVNLGRVRPNAAGVGGISGIDKRPADGPVEVRAPKGSSGRGLAGDRIVRRRAPRRRGPGGVRVRPGGHGRLERGAGPATAARLLRGEPDHGRGGRDGAVIGERGGSARRAARGDVGPHPVQHVRHLDSGAALDPAVHRAGGPGGVPAGAGARLDRRRRPGRGGPPARARRHHRHAFRALTTDAELLPHVLTAGDDLPDDVRDRILRRTSRAG